MRVHVFLATAAELPGLLDGGTLPAPGTPLTRRAPGQALYLWVADGP